MPNWVPEPPIALPRGAIIHVPGRGEMFLRDSGGDGPPVLLLHGWMFSADLNWYRAYDALIDAGYRVLAVDHRGHGRGLRTPEPFTLKDCADDAAALLAHLKVQPVMAVGYSMGGPIASLLARDHPQLVAGLVLGATSMDWSGPRMKAFWRTMAGASARARPRARAAVAARAQGRRLPATPRSPPGSRRSSAAAARSTSPRPAASSAATTRPPGSRASTRPAPSSSPPTTPPSRRPSSARWRRR